MKPIAAHHRLSGTARRRRAFSMLELQIALSILAVGLLGFTAVLKMHSRQLARAEAWCRGNPTYIMVSQTDRWMRELGAPAELNTAAGQTPWTPPVSDRTACRVSLDSLSRDLDSQVMSAEVTLEAAGG